MSEHDQSEHGSEAAGSHMDELGSVQGGVGMEDLDDQQDAGNGEQEEANASTATGNKSKQSFMEVNDQVFEEMDMEKDQAGLVQQTWASFLRSGESREACGEAIYGAIFDAAPSLQGLFKTPRAVMAMRFMNGLSNIINALSDPKALKIVVETLGFQHLDLEVTIPRVVIFRDAILDLLTVEMGAMLSPRARDGWAMMLNYVGGAYIYVRTRYADRLRILAKSWATANNKVQAVEEGEEEAVEGEGEKAEANNEGNEQVAEVFRGNEQAQTKKKSSMWERLGLKSALTNSLEAQRKAGSREDAGSMEGNDSNAMSAKTVPKTYNEMFQFNAAVMGFAGSVWMYEVLLSFDTIVMNASNSYRLQEECDVLSLRIAKSSSRNINLAEYKAVMLASLRSLLPKDWNSAHEVAWSWLWENVERMLRALLGKPAAQERALDNFFKHLDENQLGILRREVYNKFFTLAPSGQEYFKQSTTRLYFIADKVASFTIDMYKDPRRMVEDLSALGLRHVGFGIPTELFGPFVTGCVLVFRSLTQDEMAEEAFRWSLSLVSRILVRAINEGSTVVMKAINANSGKQIRRAISCAPRGQRATWMLNVQVGTQRISPLFWAIESGSLEAAKAMLIDLLTIRADRDSYYYGVDEMFEKHPDLIKRLCTDAPVLLNNVFDGLVWRSRFTQNGMRRVNYYIKHLLVDANGEFSPALECLIDLKDPKLICHPVLLLFSDLVWSRIAFLTFLYGKAWFIFNILVYVICQSILLRLDHHDQGLRTAIFVLRLFIYVFSMSQLIYHHLKNFLRNVKDKDFSMLAGLNVPSYLTSWQEQAGLGLTVTLIVMLCHEPILHCWSKSEGDYEGAGMFSETCPEAYAVRFRYSIFTMIGMVFYYWLLIDLCVFSTRVSAFVLVCGRVLSEVALFLAAVTFFIAAFACAISSLIQSNPDFDGIHKSALALLETFLGMYSTEKVAELHEDPVLLIAVILFTISVIIFLWNLLIAQLNCSYSAVYEDMVGYARLNRGQIIVEAMSMVAKNRWARFLSSLNLDSRLEFNEGDVGLAGGIQVLELASANVTTVDMIRRFGGSTSPAMQWPEEDAAMDDDDDRFDKLEKLIQKAMKRMSGKSRRGGGAGSSQGQSGMSHSSLSQSDGGSEDGGSE